MKFSKLGAALVISTLVSQVSVAQDKSASQDGDKWISGGEALSLMGHNHNHNHNNNHNHNSRMIDIKDGITTSMMS